MDTKRGRLILDYLLNLDFNKTPMSKQELIDYPT